MSLLPKPKSGMDMMAGMFGLGDVMKAAQVLADSGAIERLIKFANDLPTIQAKLDRILAYIEAKDGDGACIIGDISIPPAPSMDGTAGRDRVSGAASGAVDAGHTRLIRAD